MEGFEASNIDVDFRDLRADIFNVGDSVDTIAMIIFSLHLWYSLSTQIASSSTATAGDGSAPNKSGEAGEKFCKRPLWREIIEEHQNVNEESHNVSQVAGQNNSAGALKLSTHQSGNHGRSSADTGKSEVEQMLKQMTFTRSETQQSIALLHTRTIQESPTPLSRLKASTSGSLKRHKHGDESHNFHASVVVEEEIASPAELAKASTIGTGQAQAQAQDSKLTNNSATCLSKPPVASPEHPTTIENLPHELLSNIFIRLLAKQLAQMRSVSKSWNALLSESSFIKSHLNRSIHYKDQILLVFYDNMSPSSDSKRFTALPYRSPHLQLTNFIKLPAANPQSEYTGIRVIGSVNGLICSSYGDSLIHIWNPSLSAMLTLPPYSMPSNGYNSLRICFRFGFDPKTNDYKVIKFTGLIGQPIIFIKWWLDVEIYSMRKGSWKLVTERFPSHIGFISDDDVICLDGHEGHLHWLACIGEKIVSEKILAFSLGSEIFREIPLPDSIIQDYSRLNLLGILTEKLCVMSRVGDVRCEVWVMEEYGVVESWVKRHVISQFIGNPWPFGFTSRNEFLLDDGRHLVLYDLVANKTEIIENCSLENDAADKIVEYVDSLVWIAPAGHEMVDDVGRN